MDKRSSCEEEEEEHFGSSATDKAIKRGKSAKELSALSIEEAVASFDLVHRPLGDN